MNKEIKLTTKPPIIKIRDDEINLYIDPETGVNYLVYDRYHTGGMTIRVNADGTPYVTPLDEKLVINKKEDN